MAMAGMDLLERAWLELAAADLTTRAPRPDYRPVEESPACALCGWPEAMAFKGSVVCVRCRTQLLSGLTPPTPVAHDELGRFDTV